MFDKDAFVRCFDLANPEHVADMTKAYADEIGVENAAADVAGLLKLVTEYKIEGPVWYAGQDIDRPTEPVITQTMTIYSLIGDRIYDNDIEVLIGTTSGHVYCRPDDVY